MLKGSARAYTNIALIKYWGKQDEALIIPMNNSLSLTLDAFYTETTVTFSPQFTNDQFWLNDTLQDAKATKKISTFLDLFRQKAQQPLFAQVTSQNFVPTAAGLASSASGLAALAGACNEAFQLNLTPSELSKLARRGSGSACRSIFGGFVEWEKGTSDETSSAAQVCSNHWEDELAMLFLLINETQKDVSSRDGMRHTVQTSSFYPNWLTSTAEDLKLLKQAIAQQDFQLLGQTAESNALKMHATTLAANPPFTYWAPESLRAMDAVRALRKKGFACYFTMDAGPNVKILCPKAEVAAIKAELLTQFQPEQLITAYAGPGLQVIDKE
ncbi:MAG: diphosphomevalonate decarboxylase [Enterococcus sp.]